MISLLAALALQTAANPANPAATPDCPLSNADLEANRALTFEEFDQYRSTLRSTAWNLSMAGCHAASNNRNPLGSRLGGLPSSTPSTVAIAPSKLFCA